MIDPGNNLRPLTAQDLLEALIAADVYGDSYVGSPGGGLDYLGLDGTYNLIKAAEILNRIGGDQAVVEGDLHVD